MPMHSHTLTADRTSDVVRRTLWKDAALSLLIVLGFMSVAQLKSQSPRSLSWLKPDFRHHIGAEYDCIACAIRAGRGFSDPFHEPTGATAWMPPVLPYLMAGIYWLTGDSRDAMTIFMIVLQAAGTWLAALIVLREARKLSVIQKQSEARRRDVYIVGVLSVLLIFSGNFYQLFQQTHDTGLLLMVVSLTWVFLVRWRTRKFSILAQLAWGAWGGFVSLCSPVAGATWCIMLLRPCADSHAARGEPTVEYEQNTAERRKSFKLGRLLQEAWRCRQSAAVPLLAWALVITPWTVRNRIELGRWIPIKSNGMYEVWQSQCQDPDGLLDNDTMAKHPWSSDGDQRQRYREIGEVAFIDEKADVAWQSLRERPLEFLERVANRAVAALAYYTPAQLIDEYMAGGWPVRWARFVHPLPLIAIGCILVFSPIPIATRVSTTLLMFGLLLAPYMLISYYDRYGGMLVGLKALLILYGWASVRRCFS